MLHQNMKVLMGIARRDPKPKNLILLLTSKRHCISDSHVIEEASQNLETLYVY